MGGAAGPARSSGASRARGADHASRAAGTQYYDGAGRYLAARPPVGVGVSTGNRPQVGNTGSQYKYKYGAMGNTVYLGSRVQGLTKYLKCPILVTRATRQKLGDGFLRAQALSRRCCASPSTSRRVSPVDLYQVEASGVERRRQFFAESEAALEALEAGDFALAAHRAGMLLLDHRGDGPLLLTLSRASTALVEDGRGFDAVWTPPGK